jgi:hypothetical protein
MVEGRREDGVGWDGMEWDGVVALSHVLYVGSPNICLEV